MTKFVLRRDSAHIDCGQMVYGFIWEVVVKLVQAGFRETIAGLNDKTDWAANKDAVETQFAVPDTNDHFLVDKGRMNELNRVINV